MKNFLKGGSDVMTVSFNKKWGVIIILLLGSLITLLGVVLLIVTTSFSSDSFSFDKLSKKHPFLSKRVLIENQNDIIINFNPLRYALREYVNSLEGKVGIYFEYLPSGISIGVNDRTDVRLASLSKVPLAMAIMKKIEEGNLNLEDTVLLIESDLDSSFGELWKRGAGARLTIDELLKQSLQKSDNTAYRSLFRLLTPTEVNGVYDNLEIVISFDNTSPLVSPKSYSSILRSLYLSSYLSEENSNYILEIMTDSLFDDSISKPIPPNIPVAHKVGVFSQLETKENIFIDCGITYVPLRPYAICLFVKDTEDKAKEHAVALSRIIYEYVSTVRGSREN